MGDVFNENVLDLYINTALERHRIYKKKEAGAPKPWSEDLVYQQFFFCNLFRQYDKCSKWIIENVIPYGRWDLIVLYRFISTMELFEEIQANVDMSDLHEVHQYMGRRKDRGGAMFNGCFLRNPRVKGGWTDTWRVPFLTIENIRSQENLLQKILETGTLQEMCSFLKQFEGIGGFMSYEYSCDFEYSPMFNPSDKYTWANMGPGAKKGMSLVKYGVPGRQMNQAEWLEGAQLLFDILKQRVGDEFPDEDVSMREVEHWLCEFQKYSKYWGVLTHGHKVKYRHYGGLE